MTPESKTDIIAPMNPLDDDFMKFCLEADKKIQELNLKKETFGGKYNTIGYCAGWASIAGRKESAVDGNNDAYLQFGTQAEIQLPL